MWATQPKLKCNKKNTNDWLNIPLAMYDSSSPSFLKSVKGNPSMLKILVYKLIEQNRHVKA